ncbi:protein mono-ADP-ribosyltransferase PARP14-like [Hippoglossus hippoglossus]|uniref:protein mono-ADP-ribosyltransferase PARP14-like n=1 Tax=Hippoglossus hippoglossus TaxID=8267 RepID=UPI00148BB7DE|nr:protein mono-ADP-ribosyltransferase PARP14-like [Hippoglossus hippoglossus]
MWEKQLRFPRNKTESNWGAAAEAARTADMSDAYSYPLLVELEENNFPKIKMKLLKYFNSKKSCGGDCEVDYESGSRTAGLRFRTEQDQKNVLRKDSHQIQLDEAVLKMTVRAPPDEKTAAPAPAAASAPQKREVPSDNVNKKSEVQAEAKGRDDVAAEETLCSTSAVLGNVSEDMSLFILEMLVENIMKEPKSPSASFTLEIIHGISSVVVTFESGKESADFVARCPQNRMFTSKGLSVRPLEVTKQVAIEDTQKFEKDFLHLYFENAGEDVESVLLNEGEQFVVTFKDNQAAQKVVKEKHHIQQEEFRVYPFYSSLGAALYGKDRPSLKLPAAISEPTDNAVWRYLNDHKSALETIHSDLAKHFCNVKHGGSAVVLSPVPSILGQKDAKAIIKEWSSTVGSAFAQALSKFKSLKFQPDSEVLEECVENIGHMLQNKDVTLVHDKASGVLSVVGFVDDVNKLEQSLRKTINKIEGRVQREKAMKTDVIKVSPSIFHLLCQDGLQDKLIRLYPELKMSFTKDSPDLTVTGLRDEILEADKVIREAKYSLKRMNLEMDKSVLDLLRLEEQDELTKALLTSDGIDAAFEISAQRVELLAFSDRDLTKAEDHLKKLLMSQNISVEDCSVLKTLAWQDLVRQLQDANSKSCRRLQVLCTGKQVVVSGHKSNVMNVSSALENFLKQNAKVEESVDVKSNAIIEYIKKCKTSFLEQFKDKVTVSFRNEAICLNGSRVDVTNCKTLFENLVQSLIFESVNVTKPGVKKFFQDKETMYVTSLFGNTGCLVQLVDETSGGQNDLAQSQGPKPVYRLQTSDGVEIAVCKADLCSYPVDAVVNSSNQQLKHDGGLGAALLNAAGPQLQVECDKIINLRGQLKPGDCVITDAGGRLRCKKVIHAFGPVFDPSAPQKSHAQLKRAVKGSLELAERHGCITVALPTISRTQSFRLDLCALTIIKAVKEHCDEKYNDNTLKEIHLVNNDDAAVQAMERAVKSEFGNSGVTLQTASPRLTQARSTQSDPNCLGQVTTKEGLNITLTQGNIQDATTEVIVNTASEDLELNRGAVSNAILLAAGPNLQELINAQKARGHFGEVIVTDGCQLKSKKVFHAIAPPWDKGQGATEKILSAIFKNCLDKAEDAGLTSISLPAVGTGNLGFPRHLVASSMLSEISAFSMKKPKHLKEVVIVLYPGDAKTIQAFKDEFDKEFPSASGGPAPTRSPQKTVQQGPFSNVISSAGMHETKMGGVTIQVVTGDITNETSEVIVNSSNDSFSLKSGVSKAILEAAGQAVEGECQRLGALPNQGMIMTDPGNLRCKKILHVIGQTDPGKIRAVVKSALEMCVKKAYASVSLPAIGTGQGNVQSRQVADAIFDAVIDVLSQNTHGSLKTIRIVIFQAPMLNEFHSSMQPRAQSAASKPSDKDSGLWKKIKSFLVGGTADKPRKEEDFVIKPVAFDPACFHICGDTQAKVVSAKQWINDLITKDQNKNTIKGAAILSFSDADHQQIIDIQKTVGVSIRIEGKKDQVELTIEGFSNGVLKATAEIYTMIEKVKDDEDLKKYMVMVSTVADWQYQQQGLQYQSFDPMTNFQLEQAMQKKLTDVKVNIQGQDYTVTLPNGPATNRKGHTLQIKRIDKLKDAVPAHWDAMPPNTTCLAVPIHAGTPEYTEVLNLFQASCHRTVIKIERIQNTMLWKSLQVKKCDIEQRNGHSNNERRLFHGTTETIVNTINENGFNRAYAGKNAACYGNGTYFAVRADYSAQDTYSRPNLKGEKCMYLCQVLTGDYALGQRNMVVPPVKSNTSPQSYDSVVDNMANPSMFIIFHDVQAYPEYLITFK